MHPSCPDFDLCQDCEALPIPVHPPVHPLLKMKTPDTVVPTVYRIGRTDLRGCYSQSNTPPQTCCPPKSPNATMSLSRTASERSVSEEPSVVVPESVSPIVNSGQCSEEDSAKSVGPWRTYVPVGDLVEMNQHSTAETSVGATYVPVGDLVEMNQHSTTEIRSPPLDLNASLDVFREMWPKVNREMKHLIEAKQQPELDEHSSSYAADLENAVEANLVNLEESADSSLLQEALLATPPSPSRLPQMTELKGSPLVSVDRGLAALLHASGFRTPSPVASEAPASSCATLPALLDSIFDEQAVAPITEQQLPALSCAFVSDTTVPDGQIFPPGAEFVKSWRMLNDGETPWPETTELHFVAGEPFAPTIDVPTVAKVGRVDPGEDLDVWTGELKVCPSCLPQFVTAEVPPFIRHLMFLVDTSATGN